MATTGPGGCAVGETSEPVTTFWWMCVVPDMTLSELRAGDSEMLILPEAHMWEAGVGRAFTTAAGAFGGARVPVAAICGATYGLAHDRAGPTTGCSTTGLTPAVPPAYLEPTGYAGTSRYIDRPVVTDDDLVTAGPRNPIEFAHAVFWRLGLFSDQITDAWYRLFAHSEASAFYELTAS